MSCYKPLRVLHIGNVANNAHNIAKALRERTDVEADCFTNYYKHYISQPEWEDADIPNFECDDSKDVDWTHMDLHGYQRPSWYFETKQEASRRLKDIPLRQYCIRMTTFLQNSKADAESLRYWKELAGSSRVLSPEEMTQLGQLALGHLPVCGNDFPTFSAWRKYLMQTFSALCIPPHAPLTLSDLDYDDQKHLALLLREYDIIQTYGAWDLFFPILHAPSVPRVTFEHGTMREFPFQESSLGRKVMFAYKSAFTNIITNADAIHNVQRMGLNNYVFIPHPVDDTKFRVQPDAAFRAALLNEHDATSLYFAPARQNWELKGNDLVVRAFAQFIKKVGKGPKLLLGTWGQEIGRTRQMVRELGLTSHVAWIPPLPKRLLAKYMNACDVVLDQFILGAFGTTTPEAMACAKPVLLYFNEEDHRWCLSEAPPVINVRTAEEIAQALQKLHDNPDWAAKVGKQGAEWFARHHNIDVVVQSHLKIYQKIQNAPHCIQVPTFQGQGESLSMYDHSITCWVDCEKSSPDAVRTWLRGIKGQSALELLHKRLVKMHTNLKCILAINTPMPELEEEARRLGWLVYCQAQGLLPMLLRAGVAGILQLLRTDFVYVCSLEQPFLDAGQIEAWRILNSEDYLIVSGESHGINPYIPQRIYNRKFVIYRYLMRLLFRNKFTKSQCQSIMIRYGLNVAPPELPSESIKLNLRNMENFAQELSAEDFTLEDINKLPPQEDLLLQKMPTAQNGHIINADLNSIECREKRESLNSFPPVVGLNMTSRCNARCVFCSIQPERQKHKDSLTLDDVKKMIWLRYVSRLFVWGGIGDSLVNKDFLPIVRYLRETYPHLQLELSTNGIQLNEEVCQTLADNFTLFNVSLNAATREMWESQMRSKGFDNVCANITRLAELRPTKGSPYIRLSMVLNKANVDEAVPFVELAHRLGADGVVFVHYVPTTLVGHRDLNANQSLYLDKDYSDVVLEKAAARAEALGLAYTGPTLFNKKSDYIHFGARAMTPPPMCFDPWSTCYLTVDEDGNRQMIFCCSGFYYSIGYDKASLDEDSFRKLWNHPTARYFRRTVNCKGENPICTYCSTVDRFCPDNVGLYGIDEKIKPYFEQINRHYIENGDVDVSKIQQDVKGLLS